MLVVALAAPAPAAEATTGTVAGAVTSTTGEPVPNARVAAVSPSGRLAVSTDAHGRFSMYGLTPDTYAVSVEATGFIGVVQSGVVVLPGQTERVAVRLERTLQTIGSVRASTNAFSVGAPSDAFTVSGQAARAMAPPVSSSGLANYTAGAVQGAIASVPGVDLDAFANAIVRGGKVSDTAFSYDSVPVVQGLIAEPGGNVIGAQLPTTGIASTVVTLGGYQTQGDNALGGVVDQIPAVGSYPGRATFELGGGLGTTFRQASMQILSASPDLRWRYALASTVGDEVFTYGDGHTFFPSEAATYGLALQNRAQYSVAGNVHYRLRSNDDLSVLALVGEATYDQYGSPFAGETVGRFDGVNTIFPGETDPNAPVMTPARVHGTYDILKAQWLHTGAHSLSRLQLYQSQFGSTAGGAFWDENGFPNGAFSLLAHQGARLTGLGYDGESEAGERHHLRFGAEYRVDTSYLDQVVPTADEHITSQPTVTSFLAYVGDTWSLSPRLDLTETLRATGTHIKPSDGTPYDVRAVDPHASIAYRLGDRLALRATFDHTTVAPKPLEADRNDTKNVDANGNPPPFVPLAAETANDLTLSVEGGGRTQFRITYYADLEKNRIDVLPFNYRAAIAAGSFPNGVGIPTNVGELRTHGFDVWVRHGSLTLTANDLHGFSSSVSQFAYNGLNAAAIAAGHLFPIGYVPDLTSTLS
ncbi:MAG: TonB-dependent receptor, partial [Candidatus Eremiobacteraeota bacterium]|nr:TonB-dependent receptor [Candidatus Eremiobacteraeota bacterium]